MTNAVSADQNTIDFPVRRAVIASSIRVVLHTTVLVALFLNVLGVSAYVAILAGLALGLIASRRSQRIGLVLTENGMVVTNYFKTYFAESVKGATLHFHLRNRTEVDFDDKRRIHIQAATYFSDDERDQLEAAMSERGAAVEHTVLGK